MSELIKRALFGAIYVLIVIGAIVFRVEYTYLLFGLFLFIGFFEYRSMFRKKSKIYWTSLLFPLALWADSFFAASNYIPSHFAEITVLGAIAMITEHVLTKGSEHSIMALGTSVIVAIYLGFPLTLAPEIPLLNEAGYFDYLPLLGLFIMIWTNDTFAYLVGRAVGKHKLSKRLSPNKSIEGFIGGVVFAFGAAYALNYFGNSELEFTQWAVLALIASVGGTLGDLFESSLKRTAGVKDSGQIIPGHGGILDRIDSFLFVAPLAWLYLSQF